MEPLTVTLKVVTPMFLGGAQQESEIRGPSIKGALRFWYRAIDPGYLEHEGRIFGGTKANEGQACFLLRVSDIVEPKKRDDKDGSAGDSRWDGTKIAYLGYGPIIRGMTGNMITDRAGNQRPEQKAMTLRPYIPAGTIFSLSLFFKPETASEDLARVRKALWALVMLGGLGARSRKGFGSLVAVSEPADMGDLPPMQPKHREALVESFKNFLGSVRAAKKLPEFTSWSNHARCVVTGDGKNAEAALEWLGSQMQACRSWRGDKKQPRVTWDHDLMRNFIGNGTAPTTAPLRTAFGLPHNYFFTSLGKKKGGVDFMDNKKPGRRASPLLLHIHEFEGGSENSKACVVATYLPARLIPDGKNVRISGEDQNDVSVRLPDDFTAVTDFLSRLIVKGQEVKL